MDLSFFSLASYVIVKFKKKHNVFLLTFLTPVRVSLTHLQGEHCRDLLLEGLSYYPAGLLESPTYVVFNIDTNKEIFFIYISR